MFEKKIKKFFNSVHVCGEKPSREIRIDGRLLAIIGTAAGIVCAALGAGLAVYFLSKEEKALY